MMNFIQRNIFIQLRANKFHTNEHMEDMTNYKAHRRNGPGHRGRWL